MINAFTVKFNSFNAFLLKINRAINYEQQSIQYALYNMYYSVSSMLLQHFRNRIVIIIFIIFTKLAIKYSVVSFTWRSRAPRSHGQTVCNREAISTSCARTPALSRTRMGQLDFYYPSPFSSCNCGSSRQREITLIIFSIWGNKTQFPTSIFEMI